MKDLDTAECANLVDKAINECATDEEVKALVEKELG